MAATSAPELRPGLVVDARYEIIARIGEGGLAAIYRSRDRYSGQEVVLKLIRPDSGAGVERLRHEADILKKLHHPNIVPFIAFREGEPWTYLVMALVSGRNLGQTLRSRTAPFDVRDITPWIGSLCDTLSYLDKEDVVHRDLKPDNILITPDNRLVLIDFNVATDLALAATDPHARNPVGTASYAAPEQMAKRAVDHRADIYSLGVIIFELLTLTRPFASVGAGQTTQSRWRELQQAKTTRDPPSLAQFRPDLPKAIVAIVDKALARNPDLRWRHASELWAAWLEALGAPETVVKRVRGRVPAVQTASEKPSRKGLAVVLGLVMLVAVGIAGFFVFSQMAGPDHAPASASALGRRVPIDACDTIVMKSAAGPISWTSCVEMAELREDTLILHIRWLPQFPAKVQVDKPSDVGNPNTYLLDAQGKKYHAVRLGGDAARDVTLVSGRYYRGEYTFPRPDDLEDALTFVEDDVGIQVPFTLPLGESLSK